MKAEYDEFALKRDASAPWRIDAGPAFGDRSTARRSGKLESPVFKKSKSLASLPTPLADAGPMVPPLPELPPIPAATAKPAPRAYSTLSADLQFVGSISGAGDLQIDGASKGDVRVGRLIVGETGALDGDVAADYVEVRGRVVGNIIGKQVKLVATGYVDGDITAGQLSIDIGAYFQGRVLQGRRDAPSLSVVPALATAPAEHRPEAAGLLPA